MFRDVANRAALLRRPRLLKLRRRLADRCGVSRAQKIGKKLKRQMQRQGIEVADLAKRAGKRVDHVQAILDGFPNTTRRPTQLDTVDTIAAELGLKLDLTRRK
jgi:hypothetical protein